MPELSNRGGVMRELYYGLSREDMIDPDVTDEWDEDRFDRDEELLVLMQEIVTHPETAQNIAEAALTLMEVWYGKYNPKFHPSHENAWMTPAKALHAALIWDRG